VRRKAWKKFAQYFKLIVHGVHCQIQWQGKE
jgi:hypothetical protein